MEGKKRWMFLVAVLVLGGFLCGLAHAQTKLIPKIDNFILFPDQSGSMYMSHAKLGKVKMALAKEVMLKMNDEIPELGYKGSLYLFAPWQKIAEPAVYKRNAFGEAIAKIKADQDIFGRLTPMGPGISSLDTVLSGFSGKTGVIVVSDGGANQGPDPVAAAQAVRNKYPQVCFHVISFADEPKGAEILKKISGLGGCGVHAEGATLVADAAALKQFVKDVFYTTAAMEAKKEDVIILRGINFDFDKADIKPEWKPVLDEGAAVLAKNPNIKIIIEGHTCALGTDAYNQKLSERRAQSVFNYFVSKGISASRMKTVGYGESKPKADNATEEGRRINRRVEIKVVK